MMLLLLLLPWLLLLLFLPLLLVLLPLFQSPVKNKAALEAHVLLAVAVVSSLIELEQQQHQLQQQRKRECVCV